MNTSNRAKKVAVVGAGISGLVAGYELQKQGFEVTVFEKEDEVAGRMFSKISGNLIFDAGADFFNSPYTTLQRLAGELGVPWEETEEGSTHKIIRNNKAYNLDLASPIGILRLNILSFKSRVAFLFWLLRIKMMKTKLDFFHLSTIPNKYNLRSTKELLEKSGLSEVMNYIADPFTSLMQFHRTNEMSEASFFSLIQLMLSINGFRVCYTKGGINSIPLKLANKLKVKNSCLVQRIENSELGVTVTHNQGKEVFDSVVVATTGNVASELLSAAVVNKNRNEIFDSLHYSTTITVSILLPKEAVKDSTYLCYVPFVENQIIAGLANEIRKDVQMTESGMSLINVYLHESSASGMIHLTDGEIFEIIKRELISCCKNILTVDIDMKLNAIKRWKFAMPKFTSVLIDKVRNFEAEGQGQDNIYLAGDYMASPWAEGAARSGERVAKLISEKFT